jgi:hypothetical protein
MINYDDSATQIYVREMKDALKLSFPRLYDSEIEEAIEYSIAKRGKNTNVILENNYEKKSQESTLYQVLNYIIEREPIITVSGVMFKKHGTCPNPFVDLIQEFLISRGIYKDTMFKYPKGSEQFEKYNLLQGSEKTSANASYGAAGNNTSVFYNLFVATSITMQGQNCISTALLLFEATMANNVKFGSLNEIIMFINNVRRETRNYNDIDVLDGNISVQECFMQIMSTCGFYYIPTDRDMMIVWDMLNQMSQQDINRLFYKNNLFWFVDNKYVMNKIIFMLQKMDCHFIDPNKPPKIIKDELDEIYELIKEYVYYGHQYMDRLDRANTMYRSVSILTDTDSCFISFDGWYRYLLDKTFDIPMDIKEIETDIETGKTEKADTIRYDYDFFQDEIIEVYQDTCPDKVGPSAGFRCSLINILAHIMGRLSIEYMSSYSDNSGSMVTVDGERRKSYFILKNEFQIKRALVTMVKKNYCSYQERQEGSFIPFDEAMDVKGMPIRKVGIPKSTEDKIKSILFDFILNKEGEISQIEIVKQLAILEKQIFNSLQSGSKDYFKPVRIKSMSAYDNPMGQFGLKAAVAYNYLKDDDKELIDLTQRNSILVINTTINEKTIDEIKDTFPETYDKMSKLLKEKDFVKGINKVALPENEEVPAWIVPFINYTEIINNNITTFPVEALGIDRKDKGSVNFTNIVKI